MKKLLFAALLALVCTSAHAAEVIELNVNEMRPLELPQKAATVVLANPDPAELQTLRANSYMLRGLSEGYTSLTFYDKRQNIIADYNIVVVPDGNVTVERVRSGRVAAENLNCMGKRCLSLSQDTGGVASPTVPPLQRSFPGNMPESLTGGEPNESQLPQNPYISDMPETESASY